MRPAPGLSIEQQPERALLRLMLCGEAMGEKDAGGTLESVAMLAVGFTAYNRVKLWDATLKQVLLKPWAYSCFNPGDAVRGKLLNLWKTDPISWERADTVADLLEAGFVTDPTNGATHYVRVEMWNRPATNQQRAKWFEEPHITSGLTEERARFGHHVFALTP